jgi:signal transduction histidine kinase
VAVISSTDPPAAIGGSRPGSDGRAAVGWADIAVVVVTAAVDIFASSDFGRAESPAANIAIGLAAAICSVPLLWRRRSPAVVFLVVWVAVTASTLFVSDYRPIFPLLVALFAVARWSPPSHARVALVIGLGPMLLALRDEASTLDPGEMLVGTVGTALAFSALLVGTYLVGVRFATSRRNIERLTAERERAAQQAVAQERQRMAGELHDIVAHSVTTMTLQAAGAARVLAEDPERAAEALAAIERTGVAAARELGRLLEVITTSGASTVPERSPSLTEVLDSAAAAGLRIHSSIEPGLLATLDPSVELAVRRVVQESLTNAMRYAGRDALVEVQIGRAGPDIVVQVRDEIPQPRPRASSTPIVPGTGHGLSGLRERLRPLRGSLVAEPMPGPEGAQGWTVTARVPDQGAPLN